MGEMGEKRGKSQKVRGPTIMNQEKAECVWMQQVGGRLVGGNRVLTILFLFFKESIDRIIRVRGFGNEGGVGLK